MSRGRLVTSHVPEPAGPLSAPRSGASGRAPVQAGDRAARSQPDGQDTGEPYRRPGSGARSRDGGPASWPMSSRISKAATATCSRRSRRAPTRWKTPLRRMRFHQDAAPAGRRLFPARVFLRGGGVVQSEHRRSSRSVRCAGRRASLHPESSRVGEGHVSSLTFRSGSIAADGSVSVDPTARLASIPRVQQSDTRSGWGRCRADLQAGRGHQRAGDLSRHRVPVERHRGCPLRGIRRWRAKDLLRDLHRLQRQGDQVRVDRDDRLRVLPHVAAAGDRRAEQGHGAVSPQDRRQVRHDRPAGQREPLPDLFRRSCTHGTAASPF